MERPRVGTGVFVVKDGEILMGRRKNAHGHGTWSLPGGHLELTESFEECAKREVKEETGVEVGNVEFVGVTNDIFEDEDKHYVTIFLKCDYKSGEPRVREPDKCEKWDWFAWNDMPEPLFLSLRNLLDKGFELFD